MIPDTKLIRSDLRTSRLGFGCSRLHYLSSTRARQAILHAAFDLGFRHFDIAPSYGHGINERELGTFLSKRRSTCTVATKFGMQVSPLVDLAASVSLPLAQAALASRSLLRRFASWDERLHDLAPAFLERAILKSLRRLGLDHINVHFLHEPTAGSDSVRTIRALLPAYRSMKKKGIIGHIGLSGDFLACRAIWHELNEPDLLLQVPEAEWTNDCPPDFSFGAIARQGQTYYGQKGTNPETAEARLQDALSRRPNGVVLVSTTSVGHLESLASAAERSGRSQ